MIKKRAGKKTGKKVSLKKSYTLYDSCDKCPLSNYIDLVCNDNLQALVIEGNPPSEILNETKHMLIIEFSELSGNTHTQSVINSIKRMHLLKTQILGFSLCFDLINHGAYDKPAEFLKTQNVNIGEIKTEADKQQILKSIDSRVKSKSIQLKEESARHNKLLEDSKGEKLTAQSFNEQLAVLSKHTGFRLEKNLTLAEYAAYIKQYLEYVNITK